MSGLVAAAAAAMDALEIRAARPADADAAVPLIYSSGPGSFEYVFGDGSPDGALAFLRRAFADREGEFSHATHRVAVRGGEVVGVGAAYGADAVLRFTLAAARQILGGYGPLRGAGVIVRGLRTEQVIRPPRAGELYICHLGVRQDCRSRGVGRALLDDLLGSASAGRHRVATLDVAVGNPRAQALYERCGFRVDARRVSALRRTAGAVPDHHRMSRPLPA